MIEFSSGFWDLRHFAALDELAGKDVFSELTTERLAWYSSRLVHALADLSSVFPDTPLLWRTLHHTPKFNETSPARVAALDQLSRKVVTALNEARNRAGAEERLDLLVQHRYEEAQAALLVERSEAGRRVRPTGRRKKTFKDRMSNKAPFLNRVKERIGSKDRIKDVNLSTDETSLRGLLRFDEWGALMRGQEHTMVHEGNAVYTPPLPGGYVWGDLMLFECVQALPFICVSLLTALSSQTSTSRPLAPPAAALPLDSPSRLYLYRLSACSTPASSRYPHHVALEHVTIQARCVACISNERGKRERIQYDRRGEQGSFRQICTED